ncbi:hypothetical protein FO519_002460 [Halicephalobus sp. NKZ332]|nr:hypothetical protein FO519_002460 [Halicephalobus sp. NKZ332]
MEVQVDPLTDNPHKLWEELYSKDHICRPFKPTVSGRDPIKPDHLRFVCISDTHERLGEILHKIPPGDVLVHCGDFTNFGEPEYIRKFDQEMGQLPHKNKIVIAGNHELGFEDDEDLTLRGIKYAERGTPRGYELLKNCTYLHDNSITISGIKIYGASWHPLPGYSFSRKRGREILDCWNKVPDDVDVLLTHTPPLGHSDLFYGERWGCAELLNTIEKRVNPKFHVFGHVHEQNGCTTNGKTVFINASICTHSLSPSNYPIVFDVEIPDNFKK